VSVCLFVASLHPSDPSSDDITPYMLPLIKERENSLHRICPSVATVHTLDWQDSRATTSRPFMAEKSRRSIVESGHSSLQLLIKSTKLQDLWSISIV
jgi:hypothetical protein